MFPARARWLVPSHSCPNPPFAVCARACVLPLSYGIFICLECSGLHRSFGVHLSFVRSVTMDKWKDLELAKMRVRCGVGVGAAMHGYACLCVLGRVGPHQELKRSGGPTFVVPHSRFRRIAFSDPLILASGVLQHPRAISPTLPYSMCLCPKRPEEPCAKTVTRTQAQPIVAALPSPQLAMQT